MVVMTSVILNPISSIFLRFVIRSPSIHYCQVCCGVDTSAIMTLGDRIPA
jgi:hypothetical protein